MSKPFTDGRICDLQHVGAPSLYPDVSDLSYLILGRIGKSDTRPSAWRERLIALLEADVVRLRLSMVHLGELALRPDLAEPGLAFLERTPNIFIAETSSHEIFEQELHNGGTKLIEILERPLRRSDLAELRFSLRRGSVSGTAAARFVKTLVRRQALAETFGRAGARRTRSKSAAEQQVYERRVRALLRGDPSELPLPMKPIGYAFTWMVRTGLRRFGLPDDFLDVMRRRERQGLGWAAVQSPSRVPTHDGRRWKPSDVVAMPATTMRAAVERAYRADLDRPADAGTAYDVQHLAYVAYSDFSTIDGANLDATKGVHRHLRHLRIFRTGNLEPLLDELERRRKGA